MAYYVNNVDQYNESLLEEHLEDDECENDDGYYDQFEYDSDED